METCTSQPFGDAQTCTWQRSQPNALHRAALRCGKLSEPHGFPFHVADAGALDFDGPGENGCQAHQRKGSTNYTFAYDRYGNRWQENPGPQYSFTGNNNRLDPSSGLTYDAPGNMTNEGLGHTYFYDAENRPGAGGRHAGAVSSTMNEG